MFPVGKTRKKKAPKQNPYEVPLYTPWDVARYLRVPIWSIAALTGQNRPWLDPEFFFHHSWRAIPHPLLLDDDLVSPSDGPDDRIRISFRRFAELFVRAGVLQAFIEWPIPRSAQGEPWIDLHRSISRGLEDTQRDPVPFDDSSVEERVRKLAEPFSARLDDRQVALIQKHLTIRLERVEVKAGVPVRVYPLSREPADLSTRIIVLDPAIRFGRPTLVGRGLPTDSLFERYQAGDSIADLVADYDITPAEAEEAIRYESRPNAPFFPLYGW